MGFRLVSQVGATSRAEGPVLPYKVLCSMFYKGMRKVLANVDWEQKLYGGTIEEQWRIFKAIFHSAQ